MHMSIGNLIEGIKTNYAVNNTWFSAQTSKNSNSFEMETKKNTSVRYFRWTPMAPFHPLVRSELLTLALCHLGLDGSL